ncbi:MAG: LysM peptidoglycan-binding domain-containing protein, partial [Candidatus Marinimicrobia bacterium]|nr:LysM peptidoglycan-binding domain-containing protein [Candidatus Neomarinimicrobiota bacterium]
ASAKPKVYEYVDYTVEKGETLWCISKKLYGNSYAWIVILRDNLDILGSDYNSITPGMVLKIRTQL